MFKRVPLNKTEENTDSSNLTNANQTNSAAPPQVGSSASDSLGPASQGAEDHSIGYALVILGKTPAETKIKFLYRGDAKVPGEIFERGFIARGADTDIISHVMVPSGEGYSSADSGYVSTSTAKQSASAFPKTMDQNAFLYEINLQQNAVDINIELQSGIEEGRLHPEDAASFMHEKEMAIPSKIKPQDIKGAWPLEGQYIDDFTNCYVRTTKEQYIPNPDWVPTTAHRILDTAKHVGRAATVIGAAVDGVNLHEAYQQSQRTGDYNTFFREGARVIGGWSAAYVSGTLGAQAGVAIGSLAGPLGAVGGGVIGGAVGSIAGYLGGSELGTGAYNLATGTSHSHSPAAPEATAPVMPSIGVFQTKPSDFSASATSMPGYNPSPTVAERLWDALHPKDSNPYPHTTVTPEQASRVMDALSKDRPKNSQRPERPSATENVSSTSSTSSSLFSTPANSAPQSTFAPGYTPPPTAAEQLWDALHPKDTNPYPHTTVTQEQLTRKIDAISQEREQDSRRRDPMLPPPPPTHFNPPPPAPPPFHPNFSSGFNTSFNPSWSNLFNTGPSYTPTLNALNSFNQHHISPLASVMSNFSHAGLLNPAPTLSDFLNEKVTFKSSEDYWNDHNPFAVERAVRYAYCTEIGSISPNATRAWQIASQLLGSSYYLSYHAFTQEVHACNLIGSYNNYHPFASIGAIASFYADIGGVAHHVGQIEGIENTPADASANDYVFCFSEDIKNQVSQADMQQLMREVTEGMLVHKTAPFFSLEFNEKGFQYPVIHPFYKNTLTGKVTAILDFWMKCFLNGGYYDEAFLDSWAHTMNCDREYLKTQLIDLKTYSEDHAIQYHALRELTARYKVSQTSKGSDEHYHGQPFMTSFRIIAKQKGMEMLEKEGKLYLIPHPDFDVEYSIDLHPDHKIYLEKYRQEHGEYPADYQRLKACYEQFADEIKKTMPRLPFCQKHFAYLSVINTFCYAASTWEKIGKAPILQTVPLAVDAKVPDAFPPIPVRNYAFYPISITANDVLTKLHEQEATDAIKTDQLLEGLLTHENIEEFPNEVFTRIKGAVSATLRQKLAPYFPAGAVFEVNEEEVLELTLAIARPLLGSFIHNQKQFIAGRAIYLDEFESLEGKSFIEQMRLVKIAIDEYFSQLIAQCDDDSTNANDIIKAIYIHLASSEMQRQLQQTVKNINQRLKTEIEAVCQQIQERSDEEKVSLDGFITKLKEAGATIDVAATTAHFRTQFAGMPEVLALLNQQGKSLPDIFTDIRDFKVEKAKEKIVSLQTELKQKALKANLKEICENLQENLHHSIAHYASKLQAFTHTYLDFGSANNALTENYLHSTLSFTGEGQTAATGDDVTVKGNLRIVVNGGCGLDFSSLRARNITHDTQQFSRQMEDLHLTAETFSTCTLDGKTYGVWKQPVKTLIATSQLDYEEYVHTLARTQEVTAEERQILLTKLADYAESEDDSAIFEATNASLDQSGSTLAHFAIRFLSVDKVARLFAAHPNYLQQPDRAGYLPLHLAVLTNNPAMVDYLLHFITDLGLKKQLATQCLQLAAAQGKTKVIAVLAAVNADPNQLPPNGISPLYAAVANQHVETAQALLQHFPILNVNLHTDRYNSPLHLALENGFTELAMDLLNRGASAILRRKADDMTPWHIAASKNQINVMRLMWATSHALPNPPLPANFTLASGITALHLAAKEGNLEAIRFLVEQSEEVNAIEHNGGMTPLMLAIQSGRHEAALYLARQAKTKLTNRDGRSASLLAAQYGMSDVAGILFEGREGEDPNVCDEMGFNAAYYLVSNGATSLVLSLARAGKLDFNRLFAGENLLALALKHHPTMYKVLTVQVAGIRFIAPEQKKEVDYFLAHDNLRACQALEKTQLNTSAKKQSACLRAAAQGSVHCLRWLLLNEQATVTNEIVVAAIRSISKPVVELVMQYCQNSNLVLDNENHTTLHLAVKAGSWPLVHLLLKSGVDPTLKNRQGQTALHLVMQLKNANLLHRLLKHIPKEAWPCDLWQETLADQAMIEVLKKHAYPYLPIKVGLSTDEILLQNESSRNAGMRQLRDYPGLKRRIEEALQLGQYENVLKLLRENRGLTQAYRTDTNQPLLNAVMRTIQPIESIQEEKGEGLEEDDSGFFASIRHLIKRNKKVDRHPAENLLAYLAREVNPTLFIKQTNVLLTLLSTSDKTACFRLNLLKKYYQRALPALLNDELDKKVPFARLVLKNNYPKLLTEIIKLPGDANVFLLHDAVELGQVALCESLLASGYSDINAQNSLGQTPLIIAAKNGNMTMLRYLLKHHATVSLKDRNGNQAVHYALDQGHEEAALFLLSTMQQKHTPNRNGETPLMVAVKRDLLNATRFLIESAPIDNRNTLGRTALHEAAIHGKTAVLELLIEAGFDINATELPVSEKKFKRSAQLSPLLIAAKLGQLGCVQRLIAAGANCEYRDKLNNGLLEHAVASKNKQLLLYVWSLPLYQLRRHDPSLLLACAKGNNADALAVLIASGEVNLNAHDEQGRTAFHLACALGSLQAMKTLLEAGANPFVYDLAGMTALHLAALHGQIRSTELLLKLDQTQINDRGTSGLTPLMLAAEHGANGVIVTLQQNGADPLIADAEGLTVLDKAFFSGQISTFELIQDRFKLSFDKAYWAQLKPELRSRYQVVYAQLIEKSITIAVSEEMLALLSPLKKKIIKSEPASTSEGPTNTTQQVTERSAISASAGAPKSSVQMEYGALSTLTAATDRAYFNQVAAEVKYSYPNNRYQSAVVNNNVLPLIWQFLYCQRFDLIDLYEPDFYKETWENIETIIYGLDIPWEMQSSLISCYRWYQHAVEAQPRMVIKNPSSRSSETIEVPASLYGYAEICDDYRQGLFNITAKITSGVRIRLPEILSFIEACLEKGEFENIDCLFELDLISLTELQHLAKNEALYCPYLKHAEEKFYSLCSSSNIDYQRRGIPKKYYALVEDSIQPKDGLTPVIYAFLHSTQTDMLIELIQYRFAKDLEEGRLKGQDLWILLRNETSPTKHHELNAKIAKLPDRIVFSLFLNCKYTHTSLEAQRLFNLLDRKLPINREGLTMAQEALVNLDTNSFKQIDFMLKENIVTLEGLRATGLRPDIQQKLDQHLEQYLKERTAQTAVTPSVAGLGFYGATAVQSATISGRQEKNDGLRKPGTSSSCAQQ